VSDKENNKKWILNSRLKLSFNAKTLAVNSWTKLTLLFNTALFFL
jgi:hypothetical protein